MENIRPNEQDILNFEKKFREMIYEIQRYTEELEKFQKERLLILQEAQTRETLLRNERKTSNELRTRLKMASDVINRLEKEKIRDKMEYFNLTGNYDILIKEREILTQETLTYQTEAANLKIEIDDLKNTLRHETLQKEKLEKLLIDSKADTEQILTNIDIKIAKISKEQKYLMESATSIIQLNKRLQTFGLCSHAINERNKAEIKKLQDKLSSLSANENRESLRNEKLHPEVETLCFKVKEMIKELKFKLQDPVPFEEKLNKMLKELPTNLT